MAWQRRVLAATVRWVVRPVFGALTALGAGHVAAEMPPRLPLPPPPYLHEPPVTHPERLRPDIPYTEEEMALFRQLITPSTARPWRER